MQERLKKQLQFCLEIDKEKQIQRQTLKTDNTHENDAEHAWHMAIMTLILHEYANETIDLLKTISMLLIHDLVEIDAGDTYAYDEDATKTQEERENKAANRLFSLLPEDQATHFFQLWIEFEKGQTPEAKFAHTMDRFQPIMLNHATNGKMWKEHQVKYSQILDRNKNTSKGSKILWDVMQESFIKPHIDQEIINDKK